MSRATWLPAPDDRQVAAALVEAFTGRFGVPPAGVWAAPGRVNVIGEHTDYNAGLCLPVALPHRTYAAVRVREDDRVTVASAQQERVWTGTLAQVTPGAELGWAGYPLGVLWALAQEGVAVPGLDVLVDGRVPLGSGLSSSAALECAVAVALADLVPAAGRLDRRALAAACVRAENEVAGASTGGMDQAVALLARAGHATLLDCRDMTTRQIPWRAGPEGVELLVVDTRAAHELVDGQYAQRRAACEEAARALGVSALREVDDPATVERLAQRTGGEILARRARHVVTEIARVEQAVAALEADDTRLLGSLMHASHVSLRDDFEVSCAELDVAVDAALVAGALGARMTGGGFGGSVVALVPQDRVEAVAAEAGAAFAARGWRAPQVLLATPAGAAGRVD